MGDIIIFPRALPSYMRPCPANDAAAGQIILFTGVDHEYLIPTGVSFDRYVPIGVIQWML